ncbi:hypothetical protein VTN49DRAFT_6761 [Thermomyces lanuginosus]|uniref:uncharacterized protein n=1 Tax=Thermomyces lanuginosus TaxID=5541 RepID=UPI00374204D9
MPQPVYSNGNWPIGCGVGCLGRPLALTLRQTRKSSGTAHAKQDPGSWLCPIRLSAALHCGTSVGASGWWMAFLVGDFPSWCLPSFRPQHCCLGDGDGDVPGRSSAELLPFKRLM